MKAPASASDSWVDHDKVHGPGVEVARARKEHERPREDVEARDLVADVHQDRVRAADQDDTLHGRHQGGTRAEIARESDDRRPGYGAVATSTVFL